MKTRDFDFIKVLDDTKEGLQKGIESNQSRMSLLDELKNFFETNNLKVVQLVEEEAPVEEEPKAKK